ncbi:hypothetical protein SRABI96_04906 [Peribacillus sp. Bi96]|uniref:hypothetical protein n=1 Tax=Peribacillus sp. Bi96 TaxID=2884273 RepID=UPI001D664676|nr:hypothetical protein [Peribacillus sp. Bi96]CAH0309011.1 hypothetical protein SRABI96_04906 [Peribacillus sp. Bi96]
MSNVSNYIDVQKILSDLVGKQVQTILMARKQPNMKLKIPEIVRITQNIINDVNLPLGIGIDPGINEILQGLINRNLTKTITVKGLFNDITVDDLSVFDEIFDDFKLDSEPDYQEGSSSDSVDMTRKELGVEMTQAIQDAQLDVSKDMGPKERIKSFFNSVFNSMGQDVAKGIMWTLIFTCIALIHAIASNNHDFEVGKLVTEKISENDTVTMVKKAFVKNPEIKKPKVNLGFLRTESKLRTRPSNKSHLVSKEPISKNTVIFPVEKKGNWILVEVDTKDDLYIGWVEESKVIKFKLEGK